MKKTSVKPKAKKSRAKGIQQTAKSATAAMIMHRLRPYARPRFIVPGAIVVFALLVVLAFRASPAPGALLIRAEFNRGGHKTLVAMEHALPDYAVTVLRDQQYRPHDKAAKLDVYIPRAAKTGKPLPIIVWTHGGAWLSGDKKQAAPYYARLADNGYIVVAVNYSLAPGHRYPTPLYELNDAYAYVSAHAARYNGDANKIVLAGDSAGAQLSAQMAAAITNPEYAHNIGILSKIRPGQLAGTVLFCGIYKMEGLTQPDPTLPKIVGWGDDVAVWAYSGTRDFSSARIHQMSPYYYVTKDFPATFISGGNADPLTAAQSIPLSNMLHAIGVDVTSLFYAPDHSPGLPHEYQFTFNDDGENAFGELTDFLAAKTR